MYRAPSSETGSKPEARSSDVNYISLPILTPRRRIFTHAWAITSPTPNIHPVSPHTLGAYFSRGQSPNIHPVSPRTLGGYFSRGRGPAAMPDVHYTGEWSDSRRHRINNLFERCRFCVLRQELVMRWHEQRGGAAHRGARARVVRGRMRRRGRGRVLCFELNGEGNYLFRTSNNGGETSPFFFLPNCCNRLRSPLGTSLLSR